MKITISCRAVPKERMTTKQVRCAMGGVPGKKFDRIRNCLDYQKLIAWSAKGKGQHPLKGNLELTARIYLKPDKKGELPKKRGDLSGYIKSIEDGLQYGKIFQNDKVIIRYGAGTGIYADENERVEIELQEVA